MKLTKSQIKQLIKEELRTTLLEDWPNDSGCGETSCKEMNAEIEALRREVVRLGGKKQAWW